MRDPVMVVAGGVVGTAVGGVVANVAGVAIGGDGDVEAGEVADEGVTGSSDPPKQATADNMTAAAINVKTMRIAIT